MRTRTIPVQTLLEYLRACEPVIAQVSDRIRPSDPLSTAVMPLIAALVVLERSLRCYERTGRWPGPPPFLAAVAAEPLEAAQAIDPKDMPLLVPLWAARGLI